jgi:hypothetical protein
MAFLAGIIFWPEQGINISKKALRAFSGWNNASINHAELENINKELDQILSCTFPRIFLTHFSLPHVL